MTNPKMITRADLLRTIELLELVREHGDAQQSVDAQHLIDIYTVMVTSR